VSVNLGLILDLDKEHFCNSLQRTHRKRGTTACSPIWSKTRYCIVQIQFLN